MRSVYTIKISLLVAVLLFTKVSYAQLPDYHVQVFDESVGIHANVMRSLVIDKKDFLWMMYEDRVQRYDGHENKEFVIDNNRLISICCDEQNNIWVNSNHHIFRFANDRKGFIEIAYDTIPGILFGQFAQLKDHPLRILTNYGFYQLDTSISRFIFIKEKTIENLSQKNFNTRWKCSSVYGYTTFFASPDSLYAYNVSTKKIRSLSCNNIFSINALNEEEVIVSTWSDSSYLYNFHQHYFKLIHIAAKAHLDKNTFFRIGGIQEIKPGYWLASSNQGLLQYNDSAEQFRLLKLYNKGSPLQKTISPGNIYLDAKQNVWMVCDFGLVSFPVFHQQIGLIRNFATYATSLWGNDARNFTQDKAGNLWVATYGSFYCWNITSGIIKPYYPVQGAKNVINARSIRGIAYDGKYVILGPTDLGVWLFDPVHQIYQRPAYLPDTTGASTKRQIEGDFINQVFTLKNGNHLVIARDADYLLTAKTYILQKLKLPFNNENPISYFSYEDSLRQIWIGTSKGLYCFDSNLHFLFKISQQNGSNIFMSMCEWSRGKYLIGTGGGQGIYWLQLINNRYNLKKITPAFDHNGNINIVYKDSSNKIWLGTQNGLYRYDPFTHIAETFDYTDNVQGSSYNSNAIYRYKNILFIGGQNGINYFVPEAIQQRKDSLKVSITKIAVDNNDSSYNNPGALLHLKYFQNSIEIEYVAPYYFNPRKVEYRYLLEGVNNRWIYNNSNTSCYFTLVPAGSYTFHVAATINGADWFESKEKLFISIAPPFWHTWWFYIVCVAVIFALIFFFYRMRINQLKHELFLRTKIARDLHDDVGSTLSSLGMVSALAKKKMEEDPGKTKELLEKITRSSERMTSNMQDIVWAVNPLNDSFSEIIARMQKFASQMLELKNIELIFNADEKIKSHKVPLQYRSDLFMFFKEAVNNLAKYSNATHAWIRLYKNHHLFCLEIKDDGLGFNIHDVTDGNGLRNMRERAKNLNGSLTVLSANNNGTKIILEFPV